jgi:hypothetical protein
MALLGAPDAPAIFLSSRLSAMIIRPYWQEPFSFVSNLELARQALQPTMAAGVVWFKRWGFPEVGSKVISENDFQLGARRVKHAFRRLADEFVAAAPEQPVLRQSREPAILVMLHGHPHAVSQLPAA